jgi:DNA-binding MarR family transcriptional regulator
MRAPKSAIAIALRELLKRGYVKKKAHPVDKRSSFLLPRPAGTDLLRELESRAVDSYAALGMIRAEDVVLFERFVRGAAIEYYIGGRGLSVRELSSVEIEVARKKTLISYVERADIPIPPSCFLPSNRCVGLYLGVELVGAVELSDGLVPQVENLLCDPKAPPEILRAFLIEAGSDGLKSPVDVTRSIASSFLVPSSDNRTTLGLLIR